jgi:hypothetical protein
MSLSWPTIIGWRPASRLSKKSRLGADRATVGFVWLILITPLSMTGSIVGSAMLAIVADACLNCFVWKVHPCAVAGGPHD